MRYESVLSVYLFGWTEENYAFYPRLLHTRMPTAKNHNQHQIRENRIKFKHEPHLTLLQLMRDENRIRAWLHSTSLKNQLQ